MGKKIRITISAAIAVFGLSAIIVVAQINRSSGSHYGHFQWHTFLSALVLTGLVYAFWKVTKPAN